MTDQLDGKTSKSKSSTQVGSSQFSTLTSSSKPPTCIPSSDSLNLLCINNVEIVKKTLCLSSRENIQEENRANLEEGKQEEVNFNSMKTF